MSAIDFTHIKCPRCYRAIRVPAKERDINYVFCPETSCGFYFDIAGNILPDSVADIMPATENGRMSFFVDQLRKF